MKVAGGALLHCTGCFPALSWQADGATFSDNFRILDLASYDGIIGLDWLGKYSPMVTHWEQGWIAIQHDGRQVVLHGETADQCTHALVELQLMQEQTKEQQSVPAEVQMVLDKFQTVFEAPTGLTPRRQYGHHIPLIPGARPVSVRP